MRYLFLCLILVLGVGLSACPEGMMELEASTNKSRQAEKASETANSIMFTENAEIDNIKKRLELTSNPGQIGFITLLNQAGQPIAYYSVEGKITSSGKRLTPPVQSWSHCEAGSLGAGADTWSDCGTIADAPSDEGTWGSSSPYIYFWTTGGQYIQWNGDYLYSDKPYRLRVQPLVIAIDG